MLEPRSFRLEIFTDLYFFQTPNRLELVSSRDPLTPINKVPGDDTKEKPQPDFARASTTSTQPEENRRPILFRQPSSP